MKPIFFSKHAIDKILSIGITEEDVIKTIKEGNTKKEGKRKIRSTRKTKKSWVVAICAEYPDHMRVITVMKRK